MKTRLCALAVTLLVGCAQEIEHGLSESDANEICSALSSRGVPAQKAPEGGKKPSWSISVASKDVPQALALLTQLQLPRRPRVTSRELANHPSLLDSPATDRARQLEALEGDLEQTLESIDGVAMAAVEIVAPPTTRATAPPASKASVLLRVRARAMERLAGQKSDLQQLVAAAVENLAPSAVTLVISPVEEEFVGASIAPPSPRSALTVALAALGAVFLLGALAIGGGLELPPRLQRAAAALRTRLMSARK